MGMAWHGKGTRSRWTHDLRRNTWPREYKSPRPGNMIGRSRRPGSTHLQYQYCDAVTGTGSFITPASLLGARQIPLQCQVVIPEVRFPPLLFRPMLLSILSFSGQGQRRGRLQRMAGAAASLDMTVCSMDHGGILQLLAHGLRHLVLPQK